MRFGSVVAAFSVELADFHIYVIDVAGGDKVPRKGGPGGSFRSSFSKLDRSSHSTSLHTIPFLPFVTPKPQTGISQSDLLVINKTDIAPQVGASLEVMRRDADKMRDHGPTIFTSVKNDVGVDAVVDLVLAARRQAGADKAGKAV